MAWELKKSSKMEVVLAWLRVDRLAFTDLCQELEVSRSGTVVIAVLRDGSVRDFDRFAIRYLATHHPPIGRGEMRLICAYPSAVGMLCS